MKRTCLLLSLLLCFMVGFAKKKGEIVVKSAEEFISALGPDRTIVIDSRTPLMLTPALEELVDKGGFNEYEYYEYVKPDNDSGIGWYDNFDGMALAITGFDNLTIKSKGDRKVTMLVSPRYADVLLFESCNNLTLENLVMGHTDTGYCEAGVLELRKCKNVKIKGCDLFGCGTEAIIINHCLYVDVIDTEMHHCSYHSLHVIDSSHVRFKDCNIHDNKEFEQINVLDSYDVWFDGCNFVNLNGNLFDINQVTHFYDCFFEGCYTDNDRNVEFHDNSRESSGDEWSQWVQVAGTDVNLRNEPSLEGTKQTMKLKKGEYAQKLDETDEWVKIYQPYSVYGYAWIYKQYAPDVDADVVPPMVREFMPVIELQGVEPVDLGLSVNWSSANYGACNREQYGDFLTWHLAMVNDYPDGWRLPTADEWEELLTLPYEIVQLPSDVRVAIFTAPNGNTIAITTNGYTDEDGNQDFGFYGYYWSQTRSDDSLYPIGFIVNVPDDMCRVGKLIDSLWIGTRLVQDKQNPDNPTNK